MSRLLLGKPSLALTGFMFTGKSTVGVVLARRLGLEHLDLDREIVREAGCSIPGIFRRGGEPSFRRLEQEVLRRVITIPGRVISTGGGVVIDPENRKLLAEHSAVIWLKASPHTILQRLKRSRGPKRPLLAVADPESEIQRLLAERESCYRDCVFAVETDGREVEEVAGMIIAEISREHQH